MFHFGDELEASASAVAIAEAAPGVRLGIYDELARVAAVMNRAGTLEMHTDALERVVKSIAAQDQGQGDEALQMREEGSPDIFVHLETVQQCALAELRPGQVVDIRWGIGLKGLTVATLRPHWP